MTREELQGVLDHLLEPGRFRDYCPNGLQVEGRPEVKSVISGVTASLALIEAAVEAKADAILVHHGLFWKGDDMRVTGPKKRRLELLLGNDINLFAYHLPLDAHGELGNNAQLAQVLGLTITGRFADQEIGFLGDLPAPMSAQQVAALVGERLGRTPLLVGDATRTVRKVAWCTGGAQGYFEQAIAAGCDLYLSGEISEQTTHLARESGIPYIAAGHHATERYGVQGVGAYLARECGLAHRFIEIGNPA
ncbi:MAG TPA: Nif3-like dinuclear metal center hexameric protein [Burkholderiales bacterium]|jgi:dinuclear metal center YbgI/SA1388 family protein